MTKITKQIKTDKRAKTDIKADVHKTKVVLHIGKMALDLSRVETVRIANVLENALSIQDTQKADAKNVASSSLSLELEQQFKEKATEAIGMEFPKELTDLEKKVETARIIYQMIKEKHPDLPKFRKTKVVMHTEKKCGYKMNARALAHCHHDGKKENRICIKQKYLLTGSLESLVKTMAHEMAHTKIKSCRHCKKFWQKYEVLKVTALSILNSGDLNKRLFEANLQ